MPCNLTTLGHCALDLLIIMLLGTNGSSKLKEKLMEMWRDLKQG
jgi:hypothetical protein